MKQVILIAISALFYCTVFAQDTTKKQQSINISSSYKPVLRNAVKINFAGSQLPADTSRPYLNYKIPSQNLFYAYNPISLKPLALEQDTNLYLGNRNFVKAGFGNFTTPYVSAGVSIGDGKTSLLNLTGNYIQSKGNIVNQDYSQLNIKVAGSKFMPSTELYGGVEMNLHTYHLYGYNHALVAFKKDSIKQQFQNITLRGGYKNTKPTESGISYNPNIELNLFTSKDQVNETNAIIELPFDKVINDNFSAKLALKADITSYSTKNFLPANIKLSNSIVQINPAVNYYSELFKLHGGITFAWNNKKYELLPDIYAEIPVKDKIFSIQAGWIGRLVKNNYRNLAAINPYLSPLSFQLNTKETEYYGGIKASVAKHFNFSAKAGLVNYKDLPLFINDTLANEKSFLVSNETSINNFRIHGDFSYINQDKFSLTGGINFNGYTSLNKNARAWHTIPVEITAALRWWALKTVLIKSDLRFFEGSNYLAKGNIAKPMAGGTDLSAGVEFKITKKISIWGDANNILNSKYERWHNYEVYGANFMGGVILTF
jgi:hypothetical protein